MLLILLTLIGKVCCYYNYFVLTPINHKYCANKPKLMILNRISVDYGRIFIKIEPNMSSSSFISSNLICPITTFQSTGKVIKHFNSSREVGYWYLVMRVSGDLTSCTNNLRIGQFIDEQNDNIHMENNENLSCRSKLPVVIYGIHNQFAIWWNWPKQTLPKLQIHVLSYIRFKGTLKVQQKSPVNTILMFYDDIRTRGVNFINCSWEIQICTREKGFWCGETCIDGRLRCDGTNDCNLLTNSQLPSSDEINCDKYRNDSAIAAMKENKLTASLFLTSNMLYLLLCIVGMILAVSACKICVTNIALAKRIRRKKQLSEITSPIYSLSPVESDEESAYADVQNCSDTDSKKNSSIMISGDEETQEELLEASKEYLNVIHKNGNTIQPQFLPPKKQNGVSKGVMKMPAPVELHSLSSYQLNDHLSETSTFTNISLTSALLTQGQHAISEMNSPGSSRTFRKIFSKNMNKTSSFDRLKIQHGMSSNSSPCNGNVITKPNNDYKTKSHTISRLENNRTTNSDDEYEGFTSYVIV